jgi:hypothetical protein
MPPSPTADLAPVPAETAQVAPIAAPPPPAAPTPTPTNNVIGTLGLVLLALLALAILAAGLLFFRRRHPAIVETDTVPVTKQPLAQAPVAEPPIAQPAAVSATVTPMASSASVRRRELAPVRGALPSDGASIDLPATAPESAQERGALIEKMVAAKPDKANPFTDRRRRLHRARLIVQSLGRTFDDEPAIDLSQYPNNWPQLARRYHQAA